MSNRRKLRGGKPSKLKGRAMTSTPSLETVRRWLKATEAEGLVQRGEDEHTGKPGRPAHTWKLTEKARERPRGLPLEIMMQQVRRQENARKKRARQRASLRQKAG